MPKINSIESYEEIADLDELENKPKFVLPPAAEDNHYVNDYLTNERGIDPFIVSVFEKCGMVYEDADYHNAVFVGYDRNGKPLSEITGIAPEGRADTKTVNNILKKVRAIQQRRSSLAAVIHSSKGRIQISSLQNTIARETLSFFRSVRQEKLSEADIYALIEHIDSKGTDITEAEWLLLAALCNSGAGGEMNFSRSEGTKLYGMLKKIRPKPITTRAKSEKSCIGCLGCKSSE